MLGVNERTGLKLFGCEIIFEEFQPTNKMDGWMDVITVPKRLRRTDGRTDDMQFMR